MKSLGFALFLSVLLASMPALSAPPMYKMSADKSNLKFYAIQNNAPVTGAFNRFNADIQFDSEKLAESKIMVEVEMASVEASYDEVTNNLKLPDWLSVEAFPKAVFISKTINRMPSTDNYFAEGELTLRGQTMPLTLNFQLDESKSPVVIAKGFATIRRTDFGVGQGQWSSDDVVKNEVRVEFRIVATRQ